ncbi:MAG: copper amine oxidase, partial [Lachnospiraceae bacterium]
MNFMKTEVKMNSEKRFVICSLLIIGLSLTSNFQDFAANKPTIYINGEKISTKTAPVILKGTTY